MAARGPSGGEGPHLGQSLPGSVSAGPRTPAPPGRLSPMESPLQPLRAPSMTPSNPEAPDLAASAAARESWLGRLARALGRPRAKAGSRAGWGGSRTQQQLRDAHMPRRTGSSRSQGALGSAGAREVSQEAALGAGHELHEESLAQRVVVIGNPEQSLRLAGGGAHSGRLGGLVARALEWLRLKQPPFPDNSIRTSKYTPITFLPRNLFEQFHRVAYIYFLILILVNQIPVLAVFGRFISIVPLASVLIVTAIKDAYEDFLRHLADRRENSRPCHVWVPPPLALGTPLLVRARQQRWRAKSGREFPLGGGFVKTKWVDVRVGDLIQLACDEPAPCDMVILCSSDEAGRVFVETANLDGEVSLKTRFAVPEGEALLRSSVLHAADGFLGAAQAGAIPAQQHAAHDMNGSSNDLGSSGALEPQPVGVSVGAKGEGLALGSDGPELGVLVSEPPSRNIYEFSGYWELPEQPEALGPLSALLGSRAQGEEGAGEGEGEYCDGDHAESPTAAQNAAASAVLVGGCVGVGPSNVVLRSCVVRNTRWVVGVAVYTGHECKVVLNAMGAQSKRSRVEGHMNRDMVLLSALLVLICLVGAVGMGLWLSRWADPRAIPYIGAAGNSSFAGPAGEAAINFFSLIILLQVLVPISLYISVELIRLGQTFFMARDHRMRDARWSSGQGLLCRALNVNEDLGQVQHVLTDKTGTLTQNRMEFHSACIQGIDMAAAIEAAKAQAQAGAPPHTQGTPSQGQAEKGPAAAAHLEPADGPSCGEGEGALGEDRDGGRQAERVERKRRDVQDLGESDDADLAGLARLRPLISLSSVARPLLLGPHTGSLFVRGACCLSIPEEAGSAAQDPADDRLGPGLPAPLAEPPQGSSAGSAASSGLLMQEGGGGTREGGASREAQQGLEEFLLVLAACNSVVPTVVSRSAATGLLEMHASSGRQESERASAHSLSLSGSARAASAGQPAHAALQDLPPTAEGGGTEAAAGEPHTINEGGAGAEAGAGAAGDLLGAADAARSAQRDSEAAESVAGAAGQGAEGALGAEVLEFQGESPDEVALVKAAQQMGCSLVSRGMSSLTLVWQAPWAQDGGKDWGAEEYRILGVHEFESKRKRMSVVLRCPDGRVLLLVKGADSSMLPLFSPSGPAAAHAAAASASTSLRSAASRSLARDSEARDQSSVRASASKASHNGSLLGQYGEEGQEALASSSRDLQAVPGVEAQEWLQREAEVVEQTQEHVDRYSRSGLRTLLMGVREMGPEEAAQWASAYQQARKGLGGERERLLASVAANLESSPGLRCVGATGIEDRLQEQVPETLQLLAAAGIKIWMLTGDKPETAESIARSCGLLAPGMACIGLHAPEGVPECREALRLTSSALQRSTLLQGGAGEGGGSGEPLRAGRLSGLGSWWGSHRRRKQRKAKGPPRNACLIIDGATLAHALTEDLQEGLFDLCCSCAVVLCCRVAPIQKAAVVRLIKDHSDDLTLAIGDGANDVSMIQSAGIGVGISGEEGRQAVMSSDFAMSQFRFLGRLLLVHGHWNYHRIAYMVLYNLYKNAVFVMLLFWFTLTTAFSAVSCIGQMSLIFYSLLYTAVPTVIVGILDQDLSQSTLMALPQLYGPGIRDETYNLGAFALMMLDVMWQSVVMFLGAVLSVGGGELLGFWTLGQVWIVSLTLVVTAQLALDVHQWAWPQRFSMVLSIVLTVLIQLVIDFFVQFPEYGSFREVLVMPVFWLDVLLILVLSLLPRLVAKYLRQRIFPSDIQIAKEMEHLNTRGANGGCCGGRHKRESEGIETRR